MAITINVYGSAVDEPMSLSQPVEAMPVDAGASVALTPIAAPTDVVPVQFHGQALNAGPPSPALVQEIEAALRAVAIVASDGTAAADGMSAGAAPV